MITVRQAEPSGDRVAFTLERSDGASWDLIHASEDLALRATGDAAVVAALPLAMAAREPLRVELEVSARLHAALDTVQDVLSVWWRSPESRITVDAVVGDPEPRGDRHGGVFSHDLASFHLALAPSAPDLLLEVDADLPAGFSRPDSAGPGGAPAVVSTNLARVGADFGLDWDAQYRGAALASVAHAVTDLGRIDLPAPYSVHYLFPWGSHTVLDPLWSGDGLDVRHRHAEVDWVQRLDLVATEPGALDGVRACHRPSAQGPCRRCRGCLFLVAGLRVLGQAGDRPLDLDALRALDLTHYTALADTAVLLRHAKRSADAPLVEALEAAVRRLEADEVRWPDNWFAYLGELGSAHR